MKAVPIEEVRRAERGFLGGDGDGKQIEVRPDGDGRALTDRRLILSVMTRGMGTRDLVFAGDTPLTLLEDLIAEGQRDGFRFELPGQLFVIPAHLAKESLFSVRRED